MPGIENNGENYRSERRSSRARRLREQVAETTTQQSVTGLEQIFEAKLAAIKTYQQQLNTITDPYARKSLQMMVQKERKELVDLADLIDLVDANPEMGGITRARRRFSHQLRTTTGRDASFWLGAAVVGAILLPSVREKLRPLAVKTVQGMMELSDQVKGMFSGVQEDIEDLVSEAQFEKFKESIEAAIVEETLPSGGQDDLQ